MLDYIAVIGAQFNETVGMHAGYRYANIEFEEDLEGAREETGISLSGPFLGLSLRF